MQAHPGLAGESMISHSSAHGGNLDVPPPHHLVVELLRLVQILLALHLYHGVALQPPVRAYQNVDPVVPVLDTALGEKLGHFVLGGVVRQTTSHDTEVAARFDLGEKHMYMYITLAYRVHLEA